MTKTEMPLLGIDVVVARPSGAATTLLRRLRALGATATAVPTASLRAGEDSGRALQALRHARAGIAIFTSPAAVKFAYRLQPKFRCRMAIALGPSTARALRRRGVHAQVPERYDSEGVLALDALADLVAARIVLVTAPGGRQLLTTELTRRGALVEPAYVYRRALPRWQARHHAAFATKRPRALLISSADGLAALGSLAGVAAVAAWRLDLVVVPSARVAAAARATGFARIAVAASALPADLVAALVRSRGDRRRVW